MNTQPEHITQKRLKELFVYSNGYLLNKSIRKSQIKIGEPAGHLTKTGYTNIKVDGKLYKAHRLIFLYNHGFLPDFIDHIDCDKTNNRIENLRPCTKSQNSMNRAKSYGKTLVRNVYKRGSKFQVQVKHQKKVIYVGTFDTLDNANKAAIAARQNLFGEFA